MANKKSNYFYIIIVSIILGMIIAQQYKAVQAEFLEGANPFTRSQELMSAYEKALSERDILLSEIDILESKLTEIEESASNDNILVKNLTERLELYKLYAGFTDVTGEGIQIIIDNPVVQISNESEVNIIYEYNLLNVIVNELNAAGSEAISINDNRVINTTEIRSVGNSISINDVLNYPPFVIKSIGNKYTLEGAVNQIFGIVSIIRDKGYFVEVKKMDNIEINKYNGIVKFDYANTIKK